MFIKLLFILAGVWGRKNSWVIIKRHLRYYFEKQLIQCPCKMKSGSEHLPLQSLQKSIEKLLWSIEMIMVTSSGTNNESDGIMYPQLADNDIYLGYLHITQLRGINFEENNWYLCIIRIISCWKLILICHWRIIIWIDCDTWTSFGLFMKSIEKLWNP